MGSSPLTRGKRIVVDGQVASQGLIPAHAGKTLAVPLTSWSPRAHPRSRGENEPPSFSRSPLRGSSPLTRGKPSPPDRCRSSTGLIPAHAGKTREHGPAQGGREAHPRSRGENPVCAVIRISCRGSSPLTRGKHHVADGYRRERRLIPAHAGKTCRRGGASRRRRAHPRSRGENAIHLMPQPTVPGSSPLTRGKPPSRPSPAI